jgi:hypothetical protein
MNRATDEKRAGALWGTFIGDALAMPVHWYLAWKYADGFEAGVIDSVSLLRLEEHLGQLTVRDLRSIETKVPLETLKRHFAEALVAPTAARGFGVAQGEVSRAVATQVATFLQSGRFAA